MVIGLVIRDWGMGIRDKDGNGIGDS